MAMVPTDLKAQLTCRRCGHSREAHEVTIRGKRQSWCAVCHSTHCGMFRARRTWWFRLKGFFGYRVLAARE